MNDAFWIELLQEHIHEIAQWANEKLMLSQKEAEDDNSIDGDPVGMLPYELRCKLKDKRAFRRACRKGLIVCKNGVWTSRFENKSVLSYFFGRCICNDYVKHGVFEKGDSSFPACELERLFNVNNLRDSRKFLLNKKISRRHKSIDFLFVD